MKFVLDNWYLILAVLVSGGMLAWPALRKASGGAAVTPAQAVTLINREKAVLVDVSEPAEYAQSHAKNAKNVPFGALDKSSDLPRNKALPVVVLCPTGARAGRAAGLLRKQGFERAVALEGGTNAWRAANLPVEKAAA